MKTAKINVKRINKDLLFKGDKGIYLELVFFEKPDNYGNSGFVAQGVTREQRAAGVKGPILGNWKGGATKQQPVPPSGGPPPPPEVDDDDIPF